jgi:hypothetical protein
VNTPDDPAPLTMTAADLIAHRYSFEEHRQGVEAAYRRGIHHGVNLASDLADDATTLREARWRLTRAENMASEYRGLSRHPGRPPIVDELRRRLARRRARAT